VYKNTKEQQEYLMKKFICVMIVGVCLFSIYVGGSLIKNIYSISYDMGIMAEKISVLEEMNPLQPTKGR